MCRAPLLQLANCPLALIAFAPATPDAPSGSAWVRCRTTGLWELFRGNRVSPTFNLHEATALSAKAGGKLMSSTLSHNDRPLGEPFPLGVIDTVQRTVGVPEQKAPDRGTENLGEELSTLRSELATLRQRLSRIGEKTGTSVRKGGRQVTATVNSRPLTSLAMAFLSAVAAGFIVRALRDSPPPRGRYDFIEDWRRHLRDRF